VLDKWDTLPDMQHLQVPVFHTLTDFYENGGTADLVVISSPVHFHIPQTCEALLHGSHVLCDKPMGATVQDVDHLIGIRDGSNCWVRVGYQWSYSNAIQNLKKDIIKGTFGKPVRFKTLCFWPRDRGYYQRNDWAGKIKDAQGRWILDGPANNAMAHFLHNLFFVLGETMDTSAPLSRVRAELYRANPIDNYDTVACRIMTKAGIECLFYASHAIPEDRGPMFSFEFEEAIVTYGDPIDIITAINLHGKEKHYGSPNDDHQFQKLFEAVEAVKSPQPIFCGPEASRSQTLCINGIQESVNEIVTFPPTMIHHNEETGLRWVHGLAECLYDCYRKGVLPSDTKTSWARCGKTIDLTEYLYFPGGCQSETE